MTRTAAIVLLAVSLAVPATSATDPAVRCSGAKLKAAARKASGLLKCYANATLHGLDVDQPCLDKVLAKFDSAWQRIEAAGGCRTTVDDQNDVEAKVDTLASNLAVTLAPCGDLGGTCGGWCPFGLNCFAIGVGCFGQAEPCRCHDSTTTCPPTSTTSTTTTTTTTTTSSCPTYTSTTLGSPDCGGSGGVCFGGCANARECVPDANDVCGCTGLLRPCGVQNAAGACGGTCPAGETCIVYSPILPDGCPDAPRCGCVQSP